MNGHNTYPFNFSGTNEPKETVQPPKSPAASSGQDSDEPQDDEDEDQENEGVFNVHFSYCKIFLLSVTH